MIKCCYFQIEFPGWIVLLIMDLGVWTMLRELFQASIMFPFALSVGKWFQAVVIELRPGLQHPFLVKHHFSATQVPLIWYPNWMLKPFPATVRWLVRAPSAHSRLSRSQWNFKQLQYQYVQEKANKYSLVNLSKFKRYYFGEAFSNFILERRDLITPRHYARKQPALWFVTPSAFRFPSTRRP